MFLPNGQNILEVRNPDLNITHVIWVTQASFVGIRQITP